MATSIGHYLFGLSVAKVLAREDDEKKLTPWLATISCLPDLDMIPGLLVGNPARFHHGASHSFAGAAIFSLLGLLGLKWFTRQLSFHFFLLFESMPDLIRC